jgi:hypothetical protein
VGTKSGGERLLKHIASHRYTQGKSTSALINAGESANCMCGGCLMHFLVAAYFVSRPRARVPLQVPQRTRSSPHCPRQALAHMVLILPQILQA